MKILLHLYYPAFQSHLAGGTQAFIREIVEGLVQKGHYFTIICPHNNTYEYFNIPNTEVKPILIDLAQNNDPYNYLHNIKIIKELSRDHDMVWTIDRHIYISLGIPIALTINALCYPNELNALFGLNWNCLIGTEYTTKHVEKIFHEYCWEQRPPTIFSVPCSIPNYFFHPQENEGLSKMLNIKNNIRYILFPHRPDSGKGHKRALRVLKELLYISNNYHILIPLPPISLQKDIILENVFIESIREYACELGVEQNTTFHPWLNGAEMPSYFLFGYCTLSLSELPETFGLSVVNSIASGTPVISNGAGATVDLIPEKCGHVIFPNELSDIDVANLIHNGEDFNQTEKGKLHIKINYSNEIIVNRYNDIFENLVKSTSKEF